MAQMQDTQQMAAPGQKTTISRFTNLMGAAASLALLVGVGVWSYQLLMRDVSGVPVVRAAEGPMRVQPEDPGGHQAQHQGLSVNNVAAEGTAGAPADRLILAPAPLELTEEDEAVGQPVVAAATPDATAPAEGMTEAAPPVQMGAEEPVPAGQEALQLAAVERLAAQLAEGVEPLGELAPITETAPESAQEVQVALMAPRKVEGGLGRSLRPKLRPASLSSVQPAAAETAAAGIPEIDPDAIPAGTRLAQLGAYDSAETARKEWDRLQGKFGEYLEGKDRVVQKAKSGGRTFYRLRAMGFADLSDARRFCSALVAENAECIPVVTR